MPDPTLSVPEVRLDGEPHAITTLFAPRSGASYAANPLRYLRVPHRKGVRVEMTGDAQWSRARVLNLDADVTPELTKDGITFTPPTAGSYSVYVPGATPLHLFLESPMDGPSDDVLDVTAHGVVPDAEVLQTEQLQAILDDLAANGGGTVYFPKGVYRTGSLFASGSTLLHLHPDARLEGSIDPADYMTHPDAVATGRITTSNPVARAALLTFSDGTGGGIVGGGMLDGRGHLLREHLADGTHAQLRINLVAAIGCRDFVLRDCVLADSEFWNTHLYRCRGVRVERARVLNEIPHRDWNPHIKGIFWNNADGINSDTCDDVVIVDSFFHTGDDCLTLKLTDPEGDDSAELTRITMRRCTLRSCTSAMKVGTETRGRRVAEATFEHMLVLPDHTGSVATISVLDVATVGPVVYRDIRSLAPTRFIDITVRRRRQEQTRFGRIDGVTFENVDVLEAGPCILYGHDADHAVEGLRFANVRIAGQPLRALSDLNLEETPHVLDPTFT